MTDTVRLPRISRKSTPEPDACEVTVDVCTDPVSGVAASAYCARELRREYARCRRYAHPRAVIVCDIDRLQLINGGFGHAAGDAALRAFGNRALRSVRTSDWIGRKVEDEFVVVLPETDLAGAAVVAERIRRAMVDRPVTSGQSTFTVTLSVGYSALDTATELARFGAADLLETAEQQLALSARNGGNRITGAAIARSPPPISTQSQPRGGLTQVAASIHLSLAEDHQPRPDRPVRSRRGPTIHPSPAQAFTLRSPPGQRSSAKTQRTGHDCQQRSDELLCVRYHALSNAAATDRTSWFDPIGSRAAVLASRHDRNARRGLRSPAPGSRHRAE